MAAPAKINLSLGVGPVRPDGFHALATVYLALGLYDEVVLRPSDADEITVSGEGVDVGGVPADATNLALRAVHALARHHGQDLPVSMHVRKRIPVAGGLAGGSSDAAAALVGADTLFGLRTSREELLDLAAGLGSDVPFCLLGGTALGSGRGEQVTPVMTRGRYWWVVVADDGGLATPEVYAQFDRLHQGDEVAWPRVPDEVLAALRAGDAARLAAVLSNDLEPAALSLRPELRGVLDAGREATALGALVSGSGPTTLFLCDGPDHAEQVSDALRADLEPATSPLVVSGPAHGARVIGSHGCRVRSARRLQRRREPAQQCRQLATLGGRQARQQRPLMLEQADERPVDDLAAGRRQPDQDAPPVIRVCQPLDERPVDQAVDPVRHGPARHQGLAQQPAGGELVGRPRPSQRREHVELPGLDPVGAERGLACAVEVMADPGDPADHLHGPEVEVGALAAPRGEQVVDLVHGSERTVKNLDIETFDTEPWSGRSEMA